MKMINRGDGEALISDLGALVAGGALFGLAVDLFFLPGGVVTGGVTGIATALELLFGLPVWLMIPLVNLPLLTAAFFVFGGKFLTRTVLGIAVSGLFSWFLGFVPVSGNDPLFCALLGGMTMGAGCGIMFSRGFTTGGTDIAAWLLRRKFPSVSTGQLIFLLDALVVLAAALAFGRYEGIFYSAVAVFAFSVTVDMVMRSRDKGSLAFIFTPKSRTVAAHISEKLGRGVTVIHGTGWYSGADTDVLLCAVKRRETDRLRELVSREDPSAFTVFAETSLVVGRGFRSPG